MTDIVKELRENARPGAASQPDVAAELERWKRECGPLLDYLTGSSELCGSPVDYAKELYARLHAAEAQAAQPEAASCERCSGSGEVWVHESDRRGGSVKVAKPCACGAVRKHGFFNRAPDQQTTPQPEAARCAFCGVISDWVHSPNCPEYKQPDQPTARHHAEIIASAMVAVAPDQYESATGQQTTPQPDAEHIVAHPDERVSMTLAQYRQLTANQPEAVPSESEDSTLLPDALRYRWLLNGGYVSIEGERYIRAREMSLTRAADQQSGAPDA